MLFRIIKKVIADCAVAMKTQTFVGLVDISGAVPDAYPLAIFRTLSLQERVKGFIMTQKYNIYFLCTNSQWVGRDLYVGTTRYKYSQNPHTYFFVASMRAIGRWCK